MLKETALFFGSFNPVHVGHMIIATHVVEYGGVDRLWFIVSPHNPLKPKAGLLPVHHRIEMVRAAIGDDARFRVNDIESHLPQPSYTANTLGHLHEKYPEQRFALVMGGDNLATLHKWKNYEYILDRHRIIVYSRLGQGTIELDKHPNVSFIDAPLMQLSSTAIREMVTDGRDVRHMMPHKAWFYLDEMNFYKG